MSIIQMLDDLETGNFLLLSLSFVILFVSGFVIGIVRDYPWMIYLASVVAGIYVVFAIMYSIVNWKEWRKEKEILAELPSFPQKDYCDICGKELEEGEKKTDGEFLTIICPHCEAENIVSNEEKIQEVEKKAEVEEEGQ
jgi:phage FluMu protein Com